MNELSRTPFLKCCPSCISALHETQNLMRLHVCVCLEVFRLTSYHWFSIPSEDAHSVAETAGSASEGRSKCWKKGYTKDSSSRKVRASKFVGKFIFIFFLPRGYGDDVPHAVYAVYAEAGLFIYQQFRTGRSTLLNTEHPYAVTVTGESICPS